MSRAEREAFRDFSDGSFRALQFYTDEDSPDVVRFNLGIWLWQDVESVQGYPMPAPIGGVDGPKCCIVWLGIRLYLKASFADVALAWSNFRQRTQFTTIIGAN